MKKEFFDFVWKVIDKFGYPVLGAFILSIVTLVIAPDKYVEMVPFPDNKIYWACAILVVEYSGVCVRTVRSEGNHRIND